jgi:DNA replication protein DnaC
MTTPKRYENAKWEDVPLSIQTAFEAIKESGKGIYIHGAVGTGKTHICWAMKKHYDRPEGYRYLRIWNVVDLMHEIRSDFDRDNYDKRRPADELTRADEKRFLLILDDLGAEKATEFVAETLYRIINFRYNNLLPTIFTSNHNLSDLADKIGERSTSRIVEMCDVKELTGADRRLQK